jgi:catechol 2,3-dioxygenase-like lactoylglutathione lyase family enzyme
VAFRISGIDHVQIAGPPGCEAKARWFFGEVLAMEEIAKPAALQARGGVWFRCGEQQLHVGVEADFHPARKAHPAIRVQALPDLTQRLLQAGIKFQEDSLLMDGRRIYVDDPFGNRLEFIDGDIG